jgi:hypothetical protein
MRLGDIIRILPIARCLASHGHFVYIECLEQYWGIFDCVSYARPARPEDRATMRYGRVIELQIWPDRYAAFRRSGESWEDFVFKIHPEFAGLDRRPVFDRIHEQPTLADYGFAHPICLFSAFGYSQAKRYSVEVLFAACVDRTQLPIVFLVDQSHRDHLIRSGVDDRHMICARSAGHLPRLIRDAADFFTINSAPAIIAASVRKQFWHVLSGNAQDDTISDASQIVTVDQ